MICRCVYPTIFDPLAIVAVGGEGRKRIILITYVCLQAHIKSALIGASVTIPISNGRLATGTWQGIWYLEFRAMRHSRKVVATIQGEKA